MKSFEPGTLNLELGTWNFEPKKFSIDNSSPKLGEVPQGEGSVISF